ncbi:MAG: 4-alpha-glucanotransferase [Aliishimia sp.]
MNGVDAALKDLADAYGVHSDFFDFNGTHHPTNPDTMRALLLALGVDASTHGLVTDALHRHNAAQSAQILALEHVIQADQDNSLPVRIPCDWLLTTEDGNQICEGRAETYARLPGLSIGYYLLVATSGKQTQSARILVRPPRAPKMDAKTEKAQCWGITGALYGLRSATNGGIGNFNDLGVACRAFGSAGADFFGINPIHALGWAAGDMISPYSPTHRGFFNIDHIAVDQGLGPTPSTDLIDYSHFRQSHRVALEAEYSTFGKTSKGAEFQRWQKAQGDTLRDFAQFEALSEIHGRNYRKWPSSLQSPGKQAAKQAGPRAEFHAWLQWRAETQINDAQTAALASGMALGLYLDLAVGPRPGGAEVWMNADTIAKGVTIGAPPDHLSPNGQSWALAAHAPGPLAASFYAPLRAMLRKLMAQCGLMRIDHALGLLRSYWLPDDGSPGGYISQPLDALLAVIAIEADLAGCVIVGEDLGLVPDGFREKLNDAGLYSYSVWQYEMQHDGQIKPVNELSSNALACFSTHDTPTLQGFWHGEDIALWQRVGWLGGGETAARHAGRARQRQSLRRVCDIDPMATAAQISYAVQNTLAQAPSALLAVQLDDVFGLTDAQNLPGTIDEHPNWRRKSPVPVEEFAHHADLQSLDVTMTQNHSRPSRNEDPDE